MGGETALSHEDLLCGLQSLAERAVRRYALPATVTPKLINLSENATYRLDDSATGSKWALRVHREGYHSRTAIASELQWQIALKASGAATTPTPIRGNDGELIQTVAHEAPAEASQRRSLRLGRGTGARRDRRRGVRDFGRDRRPHARPCAHLAAAALV